MVDGFTKYCSSMTISIRKCPMENHHARKSNVMLPSERGPPAGMGLLASTATKRSAAQKIDNTHVVVLSGTGRAMVPVPEMSAFAERYGFRFAAHEMGDANRSARVERPFWFIERKFLARRSFAGWQDLYQQARPRCRRVQAA